MVRADKTRTMVKIKLILFYNLSTQCKEKSCVCHDYVFRIVAVNIILAESLKFVDNIVHNDYNVTSDAKTLMVYVYLYVV